MKKTLLTLAAGLLCASAASAATVYFDNTETNWAAVNAYVWEPQNGWPGEKATAVTVDGHALYSFEVTGAQTNIIFNNGSGAQTNDLKVVDGAVYGKSNVKGETGSNKNAIANIVDGKYVPVGGGDDPTPIDPTPSEVVIYLRGSMNGWGASDDWKFTTTDNETFVLANVDVKKSQTWKIADADWGDYNFGGATNIALDTPVALESGSGTNCNLAADGTNLTFTFVLSTATLTVTGEGGGGGDDPNPDDPDDPTETVLYLRGDMNSWGATDAWKFTSTDNETFVLANVSVKKSQAWKIADADWGVDNYGGATNIALDTPVTLYSGSNTNCTLAADGTDLTFTFVLSTRTLTVTGEGGGGGDDPNPDDPTPVDPSEGVYVYFNNTPGWEVYVWAWNDDENCTAAGEWPGDKMVATTEDGVLYWAAPEGLIPTKIIFSNPAGDKAGDGDLVYVNGATYSVDGTCVVNEENPEPVGPIEPTYTELYLLGTMNGWSADSDWKFTTEDGITYVLADVAVAGDELWKVATSDWSTNFGSANGIELDTPYELIADGDNCNLGFNGIKVTFTFNLKTAELEVTGEGEPFVQEAQELYFVGEQNAWKAAEAYKMTREENVYTIVIEEGIKDSWKISNANWTYNFGAGDEQPANNKDCEVWFGSSTDFTLTTENAPATITLTIPEGADVPGTSIPAIIKVSFASGVADVKADAVAAKYYNLQGVEVANPANGLYIEVRGNEVRKVIR